MKIAKRILKWLSLGVQNPGGSSPQQRSGLRPSEVDLSATIGVRPTCLRKVILHAIGAAADPIVTMDGRRVTNFSALGPLTRRGLRRCIDLEVRDGNRPLLGFHDSPAEMWISGEFAEVAQHCATQRWLRIVRKPA